MEVWTKKFLYKLIEGQTQFDMPRDAKMSLALNDQNRLLFIQIQALSLSMHHRWKEIPDFICKITNGKLYGINSKQKVPLSLRITLMSRKQKNIYLYDFSSL